MMQDARQTPEKRSTYFLTVPLVVLRGEGSGWSKERAIDAIDRINLEFVASRLLCQGGGGKETAVIGALRVALRREINRGPRKDQAGASAAQAGGVRRQEV